MSDGLTMRIPPMLSGQELIDRLSVFPEYDESIRAKSQTERLIALSDINRLYIPSQMSLDVYSKLYLALMRSIQKKTTAIAVKQRYENNKAVQRQAYRGIMGGSDSFSIIGCGGIGKSSAIDRAIELITDNQVIEIEKPYTKIIPVLVVQCPFDSSCKGMMLEILRTVDGYLGTDYYHKAIKSRAATTDMLIGMVSTIAINHIGLLVIDEIQNVANSKNGKVLVGMLTQLINNSGISIAFVGTPESTPFFSQALHLARRSTGLTYTSMRYDDYFESFCKILFRYQYVKTKTEITPAITHWLYEHSSGILAVVVALVYSAQEIAILTGQEVLSLDTLSQAYEERLSMLHDYIQPTITHNQRTGKKKKRIANVKDNQNVDIENGCDIAELVKRAKNEDLDIVELLRESFTIVEVEVSA